MKRSARMVARLAVLFLPPALLGGCVAKAVVDAATLPVKAASKGWDMATTSQSEADEKRGRQLRKREEEIGKLSRQRERAAVDCRDGGDDACDQVREIDDAIANLENQPPRR